MRAPHTSRGPMSLPDFNPAAERTDADTRNQAIRELQQALVRFGREFGLLDGAICDCDDPQCSNKSVDSMTVERLLDWVSNEWHARAGCEHDEEGDPDPTLGVDALRTRNLALVGHFADRLGRLSDVGWTRAARRFRALGETPLFREAEALVPHGVETMLPDLEDEEAPTLAVAAAERWLERAGVPSETDQEVEDATRCAVWALLAHGIADRRLAEALFEPFAPLIPLNELLFAACRPLPPR